MNLGQWLLTYGLLQPAAVLRQARWVVIAAVDHCTFTATSLDTPNCFFTFVRLARLGPVVVVVVVVVVIVVVVVVIVEEVTTSLTLTLPTHAPILLMIARLTL